MTTDLFQRLHRRISPLVHQLDPASVGGTAGEYDHEVNEIVRHLMAAPSPPFSKAEIAALFHPNWGELDESVLELLQQEIQKQAAEQN